MSNDARFIGNIPENYDRGLGPVIFVDCAADLARRTASGGPKRVLETAAGTGIVTRALRDALSGDVHITASDLNQPMLDVAGLKFRAGEQVDFQTADATALPFKDGSFDAVVCQFGVMFFPDKDEAYREVLRVLTPGGRYHFNVWDSHRFNPFGRIGQAVVGSFFPDDPPQFLRVPFSYPFEPIKDSLVAAGFTNINLSVLRFEKEISDADAFARGIVFGNPLIDQIRTRGGVEPEAVVEALVAGFRREFGADPGLMPLQALVFSAEKPS